MLDYWAHAYCDDPKLRDTDFTDDFATQLVELEKMVMAQFADQNAPAADAPAPADVPTADAPPADEPGPLKVTSHVTVSPGDPSDEEEWETLASDRW